MRSLKVKRIIRNIKKYKQIIVYGAGGIGIKIANWLKGNSVSNFVFAVSSKKQNADQIDGILVKQIDELLEDKDDALVIVATLPKIQNEIIQTLQKYNFKNWITVDDDLLKAMGIVLVNGLYPEKNATYYAWLNEKTKGFFQAFSCKNVIVFESRVDYTDNAKALSEYIQDTMPGKYKLVWIVKEPHKIEKRKGITYISRHQLSTRNIIRLNYYISVAKYVFFTHPNWLKEWKAEQHVINLGHGNPLKRADIKNEYGADIVLASGEDGIAYRKLEYKDLIDVAVLGPPRNDWLFGENEAIRKTYVGERNVKKVIMCFPTYKQYDVRLGNINRIKYDSKEINSYCLNTIHSEEELIKLNEYLYENQVLLICKEHYLQKKTETNNLSNILYIDDELLQKNGYDLYELFSLADALITDFSSIYMDYLLLDRPIGFFANTIEQYERGFIVENPEKYMPGKKIYCNEELLSFIDNLLKDKDIYKQERKLARDLVFKYQDDQNCKRCAEYFGL